MSKDLPVVVIGTGIGGLSAAARLCAAKVPTLVLERASAIGGKLRQVDCAGQLRDAGPSVFTLKSVFSELFEELGEDMDSHLPTHRLEVLARHSWPDQSKLDLYADPEQSIAAIADFSSAAEARRFTKFQQQAKRLFETLYPSFIRQVSGSLPGLVSGSGVLGLGAMLRSSPFQSLYAMLQGSFRDPRLAQLFGRYATYTGSSPFHAPAVLSLITHVELAGVWHIEGGMHQLAQSLATLVDKHSGEIRTNAEVVEIRCANDSVQGVQLADGEFIKARAVICNADTAAVRTGLLGATAAKSVKDHGYPRSLSALTWNVRATSKGFPIEHHNVFFSSDYAAEFRALFTDRRLANEPTIYLCAQDRHHGATNDANGEHLFFLVNAPAGTSVDAPAEIDRMQQRLAEHDFMLENIEGSVTTTPADFGRYFPGSEGALYGDACHHWQMPFRRPSPITETSGLFLAGGGVHPGPGLPMAALSGRHAAEAFLSAQDARYA